MGQCRVLPLYLILAGLLKYQVAVRRAAADGKDARFSQMLYVTIFLRLRSGLTHSR